MSNYAPSTRQRIGDINAGMLVETAVLTGTTYLIQNQVEGFDVVGRNLLYQIFLECATDIDGAAYVAFNYTFSTPVIAVKPFGGTGVSGSIDAFVQGSRVTWPGGTVASNTAQPITVATGGFSDAISAKPVIIGGRGMVGTIGWVTTNANATAGTFTVGLLYVPILPGSYIAAKL